MKLIRETSYDVQVLNEKKGDTLEQYIEGIFAQSDVLNGNGRIYPDSVMERAVERYIIEKIQKGCSWGELDHPDTPTVQLTKASHRIVSLEKNGNNYVGKAIICDTINGNQVKGLIKAGGTLAVSTRGLASVVEESGASIVQGDFNLCTVDIVSDPSAPNAFVKGILEGKEWILDSGVFKLKEVDTLRKIAKESPDPMKEVKMYDAIYDFMQALGDGKVDLS